MNKISKVHFVDGDRQIAIGARLSPRACRFIL